MKVLPTVLRIVATGSKHVVPGLVTVEGVRYQYSYIPMDLDSAVGLQRKWLRHKKYLGLFTESYGYEIACSFQKCLFSSTDMLGPPTDRLNV